MHMHEQRYDTRRHSINAGKKRKERRKEQRSESDWKTRQTDRQVAASPARL